MSWDWIDGQLKQRRGKAMHLWGKGTNDEMADIAGKYQDLVGRLQERYGIVKEEAKRRVDELKRTVEQLKKSNNELLGVQKGIDENDDGGSKTGEINDYSEGRAAIQN